MNRIACAELIRDALAPEDIVLCSLGSVNRSWRSVAAPQPSYFCSDPMGLALSIALGVALSLPHRRVLAICGDGDLMLGLPALVTTAGAAPANLRVIVFNNHRYETGGGQPLASPAASFALLARGAGFAWSAEATAADAQALVAELLVLPGLGLLSVEIDGEAFGYAEPPDVSQAEERTFFMARLAESDSRRTNR